MICSRGEGDAQAQGDGKLMAADASMPVAKRAKKDEAPVEKVSTDARVGVQSIRLTPYFLIGCCGLLRPSHRTILVFVFIQTCQQQDC